MKKSKILKTLTVFGAAVCAPLLLTGCGETQNQIDFRVQDGFIQVTENGKTWINLIDVDDLKGEPGAPGQNGVGEDGKEVEFQVTETHIQWRYAGDATWTDLIALEDIKGEPGEDLTAEKVTVNLDSNIPIYFERDFADATEESIKQSWSCEATQKSIDKGDWVNLTDFSDIPSISKYFLGWYAGSGINETRFTSYTPIADNVRLHAKWDIEKIEKEYYSEGVKFKLASRYNVYGDIDKDTVKWDMPEDVASGYVAFMDEYTTKDIVIPKTYNGVNVVGVGELDSSHDIYLPEGLKFIVNDASLGAGNNLYIPKSVVAIGYNGISAGTDAYIETGIELEFIGDDAITHSTHDLEYDNPFDESDYRGHNRSATVIISSEVKYVGKNCLNSDINVIVNNSEDDISDEVFVENCFQFNTKVNYYKIDTSSMQVKRYRSGSINLEYVIVNQDNPHDTRPLIIDMFCSSGLDYANVGSKETDYLCFDDVCVIDELCITLNVTCDRFVIWNGIKNLKGEVTVYGIDNSTESVAVFNYVTNASDIEWQNAITDNVQTIYLTVKYNQNMDLVEDFIKDNFTKQATSDKDGYDMYVRNTTN